MDTSQMVLVRKKPYTVRAGGRAGLIVAVNEATGLNLGDRVLQYVAPGGKVVLVRAEIPEPGQAVVKEVKVTRRLPMKRKK